MFEGFPGVLSGPAADEAPDVGIKSAELLLDFKEGAGVTDGGVDFQAVADDSGGSEQSANLLFVGAGHFLLGKSVQHFTIARAVSLCRFPSPTLLVAFVDHELNTL